MIIKNIRLKFHGLPRILTRVISGGPENSDNSDILMKSTKILWRDWYLRPLEGSGVRSKKSGNFWRDYCRLNIILSMDLKDVRIRSDNSDWRLEFVFHGLAIPSYDSYGFMSKSFRNKYLNPKTRVFSHSPWNWRDSKAWYSFQVAAYPSSPWNWIPNAPILSSVMIVPNLPKLDHILLNNPNFYQFGQVS